MTVPERFDGYWGLPIVGEAVTQLSFDYAVTLLFGNGAHLRVEGPFALSGTPAERDLDPQGDAELLAPALALSRLTVTDGKAFDDGSLQLAFSSGLGLSVSPLAEFEAWQFTGAGGLLMVSMPGGGVSVWESDD